MYKTKTKQITNYKLLLALLAVFAIVFAPQMTVTAQGPTPTDDEVNRIAKQLYCPVCESTPLDVCPTEACRQWRDLIRTMLSEGKSEAEIKQYFVTQYGARVLSEPPNRLVTYLVPAVAILLGALMLFRGFQMWMKPSTAGRYGGNRPRSEACAGSVYCQAGRRTKAKEIITNLAKVGHERSSSTLKTFARF